VTERIVDRFEVIDIDEQQAIFTAVAMRAPAPAVKFFHEVAAVEQRRERIARDKPLELGNARL